MNTQSDTKEGIVSLPSNSNLAAKEGYLAKLVNSAGTAKADIAAAVTDNAVFVIEDGGAASGDVVDLRPLIPNRNSRVKVAAASVGGNAGDLLQLKADGTVDVDSGAGARVVIGIAEEAYVAGQLVKLRPMIMKYLS